MRILASAQITSSLYASEYIYSNSTNKTYLTARYNFTLQGVDTSVLTRKIALGIGGSEANYFRLSHGSTATYTTGTKNIQRSHISSKIHSGSGVEMDLNNVYVISAGFDIWEHYYLKSLTSYYRAVAGGMVTVSGITAAFAKPIFTLFFSLGFSGQGVGLSITPGLTTTIVDEKSYTCFLEESCIIQ
jgi:hypothetical protein